MIHERHVVLFRFPQTSQTKGKLRPALVIRKVPGPHEDWLICLISSRLSQEVEHFDEIISEKDDDFISSGLKQAAGLCLVPNITMIAWITDSIHCQRPEGDLRGVGVFTRFINLKDLRKRTGGLYSCYLLRMAAWDLFVLTFKPVFHMLIFSQSEFISKKERRQS